MNSLLHHLGFWKLRWLYKRYITYRKSDFFYYVDSCSRQAGITEEHGLSWKKPMATLDAAVQRCPANSAIFLAPDHTEVVTSDIVIDKYDIAIQGFPTRFNGPTFTFVNEGENEKTILYDSDEGVTGGRNEEADL